MPTFKINRDLCFYTNTITIHSLQVVLKIDVPITTHDDDNQGAMTMEIVLKI